MPRKTGKLESHAITVELKGSSYQLEPSIEAFMKLSEQYNGLRNVAKRVVDMDLLAITSVIIHGADLKGSAADKIMKQVFESGIANSVASATDYITLLMMGGVASSDNEQNEGDSGNA